MIRARWLTPNAPARPCVYPGCPDYAVPGGRGRCQTHAQQAVRAADQARGKTADRGYDATWRKLSALKLKRNPRCEIRTHCKGLIPDDAAVEVDHIIPIRERPDLRLSWSNLQSACKACHSAKTARESSGWGEPALHARAVEVR